MISIQNETMSSNGSNDSSIWAESIARTTLKMARLMEDGEMLPTDGMSKLHVSWEREGEGRVICLSQFVLESRREETGLDEKGSLFHLSTTLNPSIAKARYELGMHSFYMIENDVYPDTIVNILEVWKKLFIRDCVPFSASTVGYITMYYSIGGYG